MCSRADRSPELPVDCAEGAGGGGGGGVGADCFGVGGAGGGVGDADEVVGPGRLDLGVVGVVGGIEGE